MIVGTKQKKKAFQKVSHRGPSTLHDLALFAQGTIAIVKLSLQELQFRRIIQVRKQLRRRKGGWMAML